MAWDSQENRQFAQTLADSYLAGYDPKAFEARKRYNDEKTWQDKVRGRQEEQWMREDAERAAIRQLGYEAQNGVMVPDSDNSYDVAEGKRLGMNVQSTVQRTPLAETDIEKRYGHIALDAGKYGDFIASRQRAKVLEQEQADKAFGADMQKINSGDMATLAKYAKEYNKDTTVPGMITLIQGKPHYVDPNTGMPVPVNFAQIAQVLSAGHAMGRGNWKEGVAMQLNQQQYLDQRGDKKQEFELQGRQVGAVEMNAKTNATEAAERARHNKAMEGLTAQKYANDAKESSARSAAMNNMGKFGPMVQGVGPNGEAVPMVTVMGRDGSISYQQVPMPEGVTFRQQVDPKIVEGIAARLEGTPTGRLINGKPELHTPETAYSAALSRAQQFRSGGAPSPVGQDAAAVLKLLQAQPAPQAPAMAGRGAPRSQAPAQVESPTARARREAYERRKQESR